MAISERRRLTYTAIAVILVGIITGYLLGSVLASGAPPTKTFNIVAYHYGFALYDEGWNEIKQIEVKRGTTVRLVALPASFLPDELRKQLWQRTVTKGFGQYGPGAPGLSNLIEKTYNDPATTNHGILIAELNVDLRPKENAATLEDAIDSVEFKADAIGTFKIVCSVYCGEGHPYMVLERALVVR